jgi:hypothetical protein
VVTTLQALYTERMPDCPYVFAHATGRQAGQPVKDVKNGFNTALEIAEIKDFTWLQHRRRYGRRERRGQEKGNVLRNESSGPR